jgi:hypothetical protein
VEAQIEIQHLQDHQDHQLLVEVQHTEDHRTDLMGEEAMDLTEVAEAVAASYQIH